MSKECSATSIDYEYFWPIGMDVCAGRPLHFLDVRRMAKIRSGEKVLEIGAGYPHYKLYSGQVGLKGLFIAVDVNENIQRRSRNFCTILNRLLPKGRREAQVVADGKMTPFPDNHFDLFMANNFVDGSDYINEAYRVLKPGGRLVVSSLECHFAVPAMLKIWTRQYKDAGFQKIRVRPGIFPPGPAAVLLWHWFIMGTKPGNLY